MKNPIIAMGAVTGSPSAAELTVWLETLRKQNITQFMIYPRSGLSVEYLSEEWFGICRHLICECERLGFTDVWLYDEFNWPSGQCAGRVMAQSTDYQLHYKVFYQQGEKFFSEVRINPNCPNLLNYDAVKLFIELTHEEYAKRFGKYFGKLIRGIFTDEPGIGYYGVKMEKDAFYLPWYDELDGEYLAAAGRCLEDDIAAGDESVWRPCCNELLAKRFRRCYADQVRKWCDEHDLLLTGHLMEEHDSDGAMRYSGHALEILKCFSLPGVDLTTCTQALDIDAEVLTLATGMYAIEHNSNAGGLAELLAVAPCDVTVSRIRRHIWLLALHGVDHYITGLAALDMRGNKPKPRYFNPVSPVNPWFAQYSMLLDEARRAAAFAGKKRKHPIYIRYAYTSGRIKDLLLELVKRQYTAALLMNDDIADGKVILHCQCDGTVIDEISGRKFQFNDELWSYLEQLDLREVSFFEQDKSLAKDLLIRNYADGSAVVLNFSTARRELFMQRQNALIPCVIEPEGVLLLPAWRVTLSAPNCRPVRLQDNSYTFELKAACSLIFAVRSFEKTLTVLLDEQPLTTAEKCTVLPNGFDNLYLQSSTVTLEAGTHNLCFTDKEGAEDYPFLPAAYIAGNFSADVDGAWLPQRDAAGVCGTLEQIAEVIVPVNARGFTLDTQGMLCEVFVDNTSFGKRAWEPFYWQIPPEKCGQTINIRIVRYPDCSALFTGNKARYSNITRFMPEDKTPLFYCDIIWQY